MKKKILVFIRRSYIEFEFLYPILKNLKSNYDIYFYFENYSSFSSLKSSKKNFQVFKKLSSKYYIKKIVDKLFYRLLLKLFIKNSIFNNIKNVTNKQIHSLDNVCRKLGILNKNEIKFILTDINTKSQTLLEIIKENNSTQIYLFSPTPQNIENSLVNIIKKRKYLFDNIDKVLLPFRIDRKKFSKKYLKKFCYVGNTIFDGVKIKKKYKRNFITVAYNGDINFNVKEYEFAKNFIKILKKINQHKVLIKFHPIKYNLKILSLFKNHQNKNFKISNENLISIVPKSLLFISIDNTAAISYANYFKIPALAYDNFTSRIATDSYQVQKKLVKNCYNLKLLEKQINKIIKNKSDLHHIQNKSFQSIYPKIVSPKKYFSKLFNDKN